jgi:hypothetical protein
MEDPELAVLRVVHQQALVDLARYAEIERELAAELAIARARLGALERIAETARTYRRMLNDAYGGSAVPELEELLAALDVVPDS